MNRSEAITLVDLTRHAQTRLCSRRIRPEAVVAAIEFGRQVRARGAEIFVLGRRDIARARRAGVDLADLEGVQVICAPNGGPVLTCYRNRNVSGIRDRGWRGARSYA